MVTQEQLRNGIKISKERARPTEDNEPKTRTIWDKIAKLEAHELCLECERRKWKNKSIQVCLDCAKSRDELKCCHCKISYVNHKYCAKAGSIYKRELCMSCASNWATYNCDPKLCRLCNQWSAWRSTSECDTCYDLLQKYGEPLQCESCGNHAAFDRGEAARQRVSNLRLCFLCTCNYKRNDYYNRKLMRNTTHDSTSGKGDGRHSQSRRTLRSSENGTRSTENERGQPSKVESTGSDSHAALIREIKDLKDSFDNLRQKYSELQEENIQLKKKIRTMSNR